MKKFMSIFLASVLFFVMSIEIVAEYVVVPENEFDDTSVIVTIKHEYSDVNKVYTADDFKCDLISSVEDLTPVQTDSLTESNYNLEKWKKILKLNLKEGSERNVESVIEILSENEMVQSVNKNHIYKLTLDSAGEDYDISTSAMYASTLSNRVSAVITPNDEFVNINSYGIENTMANRAWGITTGDSSVKVGIIDTGYSSHEDLDSNYSSTIQFNFTEESGFEDNVGHGSHVAGIIGACGNNEIGVAGVCWNVTLVNLKAYQRFVTSDNKVTGRTKVSWVVNAINTAASLGVDVLNISGSAHDPDYLTDLENAIVNFDGIIVASAGNRASSSIAYPAGCSAENVIAVAAVDASNNLCEFSNYNSSLVHIAAPGKNIFSTIPANDYIANSGTSMAAPYVTGAAALLLSIDPNMSFSQIRRLLLSNVDYQESLEGKVSTSGTLNIFSAVLDAKGYTMGDVDLDGVYTEDDKNMIISYSSRLVTPNNTQRVLSDMNFDGYITSADARLVSQLIAI